jgi:hypothetical protein
VKKPIRMMTAPLSERQKLLRLRGGCWSMIVDRL